MRKVFSKDQTFGSNASDDTTIEATRYGFTVTATIHHDPDHDAPWDSEDGHGPVSDWTTRDKAPGERTLCTDRNSKRFYDFAEAVKIAKREGWDAKPYDKKETPGQTAAKAVLADFQRMRDWCRDEWWYVGVAVTVSRAGVELVGKYDHAVWGIESDAGAYLVEVANELAPEAIEAARAKLAELRKAVA